MIDQTNKSLLDKSWFAIVTFVIFIGVVVTVWLALPAFLAKNLATLSERGAFGDSFGSVNALFTGLAFAGVVFTILLQIRELRLQRADFLQQLEAMHQSKEEVEEQNKILRAQVEVQLLDTVTRAIELEGQADALAATQWVPGSGPHNEHVQAMRVGASDIRKRVGDLQAKIINAYQDAS